MITQKLKNQWGDAAYALLLREGGVYAPAASSVTRYLTIAFQKDSWAAITNDNFFEESSARCITAKLQEDIDRKRPSTSTVADVLLKVYGNRLGQS